MINDNPQLLSFTDIQIDYSWSFADKKRSDTTYLTHGYHSYPAKFIPQLASRLIEKYTQPLDLVVDPFGGCGTTLVESKVMGRRSVGVDINPVAVLIAQAKITPQIPLEIAQAYTNLKSRFGLYDERIELRTHNHERIDYWFRPEEKRKLSFIYDTILQIGNKTTQRFFFCAFSNILKSTSIWLQKSNKPTRDLGKIPANPFTAFSRQVSAMMKGNAQFYEALKNHGLLDISCEVHLADARAIPVEDGSASLIVTSPPYVTSYEYADLHQLSALWLKYVTDLKDFRKQFIGTSYHEDKSVDLNSSLAFSIYNNLFEQDKKTATGVAVYFSEMNQVFQEMHRILKQGGKTCIVIGNTKLRGIEILNAEVFTEQLQNLGFVLIDVIKREIPSKNLPSIRDASTGRFTSVDDENGVHVYPTEYIIVLEKL